MIHSPATASKTRAQRRLSRNGEHQNRTRNLRTVKNTTKKGGNSQGLTNGEGCLLHGPNCGHSQGDCKVLKAKAEKRKRYRSRTNVQRQHDAAQHRNKKTTKTKRATLYPKKMWLNTTKIQQNLAKEESHMVEPSQIRKNDQIERQAISATLDEISGEHE